MAEISEQDFKALKDQVLALSNQLNAARRRIQDLENFATDHIGLDWGEALVDINAPHPNISVNTIESGGGAIRQDANGMQVQTTGVQRTALYFVDSLKSNPASGNYVARVSGQANSSLSSVRMTATLGSAISDVIVGSTASIPSVELTINLASTTPRAKLYPVTSSVAMFELQDTVVRFLGLSSDPSTLLDGMLWYNTTSKQLKARVNGSTVVLA